MASNRPGFLFCSTSVSHHLLPSIYICLGLLSPSCLKAPNPRNACILRISDSLYGGSRYIKGIYIYIYKKMKIQNSRGQGFPNLQLSPEELAILQLLTTNLHQIIKVYSANVCNTNFQCGTSKNRQLKAKNLLGPMVWTHAILHPLKTAKSRYHSRVCIGLGALANQHRKKKWCRKINVYPNTLYLGKFDIYIYINLYGKCRQIKPTLNVWDTVFMRVLFPDLNQAICICFQ